MFSFHPLTPDRWSDLEQLFGARGACGGCWCMWYRLPRQEYEDGKGETNRRRLKRLVGKRPAGILAYDGNSPVGWCSVAPRADYRRLATARTMKPVDDTPAWVIMCLFVRVDYRRQGASSKLIRAATDYALANGAPAVDAFPIVPAGDVAPPFASQGTLPAYLAAGFTVVARPSASRAIVRYTP